MLLELPPQALRLPPRRVVAVTAMPPLSTPRRLMRTAMMSSMWVLADGLVLSPSFMGEVFSTALDVMDMLQISGGLQMGRDDGGCR